MNKLGFLSAQLVSKTMQKACTKTWVSFSLYTQKSWFLVFAGFKTTTNHVLNQLFTKLLHNLVCQINRLNCVVLHVLHMSYGYYELNILNTNKETIICN